MIWTHRKRRDATKPAILLDISFQNQHLLYAPFNVGLGNHAILIINISSTIKAPRTSRMIPPLERFVSLVDVKPSSIAIVQMVSPKRQTYRLHTQS